MFAQRLWRLGAQSRHLLLPRAQEQDLQTPTLLQEQHFGMVFSLTVGKAAALCPCPSRQRQRPNKKLPDEHTSQTSEKEGSPKGSPEGFQTSVQKH